MRVEALAVGFLVMKRHRDDGKRHRQRERNSVRLQRRAFNFRRGVTNASTSRRIIAAMLRHDESVDNVGTKTKASNEREQRRFVGSA